MICGAIILTTFGIIFSTYYVVSTQDGDALVINMAGRQRMLSQKMSKEALGVQKGENANDYRKALAGTSKLFDTTLTNLVIGGKAPGVNDDTAMLPPTTCTTILEQMNIVNGIWKDFNLAVQRVLKSDNNSPEFTKAISSIEKLSLPLLKNMNGAVKLYEKEAGAKIATLKTLLVIFLLATIIVAVAGLLIVTRRVTRPIKQIADVAVELADGNLKQEINIFQKDEVGQLADAFRTMIDGMQAKASVAGSIAKGDLDVEVKVLSPEDVLGHSMNEMKDAIHALDTDMKLLALAAKEGRLGFRADTLKHKGNFRKIIQGANDTLEGVELPLNHIGAMMKRLANYDITVQITEEYLGKYKEIKDSCNTTAHSLNETMVQVAQSVDQISSASEQIASSSQSVAEGASEQASALEETSSSMEQMAGMTRQNADNSSQANTQAQQSTDQANTGQDAMSNMVKAMNDIRQSSQQTAAIIKDINEIAFQTNLLALNAAVEAARAGDAGRGFAVVAEEVRNLAQRAKEAASKTEELILHSGKLAENGEGLSKDVSGNLTEIVESIKKVTQIVKEIAVASDEQSRGIEQINTGLSQMDKVTQNNAATSEESSSAAEELSSQAQELAAMVGRFKLNKSDNESKGAPGPAPSAPKPNTNLAAGNNAPVTDIPPEELIPMDDDPVFQDF